MHFLMCILSCFASILWIWLLLTGDCNSRDFEEENILRCLLTTKNISLQWSLRLQYLHLIPYRLSKNIVKV